MAPVLHQFLYSHFNEKARWALAYKGLQHSRRSYLPGPHMPSIRRLSGQTQTPVLEDEATVVAGSAAIIDHLEKVHPTPPLYPEDPSQRAAALELQAEFDQTVGPDTRTVLFAELLHEPGYLVAMFAKDRSPLGRAAYRATLPLAKPLIAKGNGVADPANVTRAQQATAAVLDRVASATEATGYLIGAQFSIADLTAAALLAPLASLEHPDMRRPEPMPERLRLFYAQWQAHPALEWVRSQYTEHRP